MSITMLYLIMKQENNINKTESSVEAIERLAEDYATYSNKNTEYSSPDASSLRCTDHTPKGKKAASTRKYNKFADACEKAGLTLKEQNEILRKYY